MAEESAGTIGEAAEDAIRQATGDWRKAQRLIRERVDDDPVLKEAILNRSLRRELREAASRLGAATVPCLSCGEPIPLDATGCRFCGSPAGEEPTAAVPRPPSRSEAESGPIIRHFTLLTGWILIVLIVILIISFTR